MSYITAHADDLGLIDFGCNSYGGLAIRDSHPAYELGQLNDGCEMEDETSYDSDHIERCRQDSGSNFAYLLHADEQKTQKVKSFSRRDDSERRFICEHNLALFWQRPGLYPHTFGFPVPLLDTAQIYSNGIRNRPLGHLRLDCAKIRHFQRNLLAGRWRKNGNNIQLYAVNDLSDHKALLTFNVNVDSTNDDSKFTRVCLDNESEIMKLNLPHEALQLRAYESSECENKVFVRTKRSLLLVDTFEEETTLSTIFQASARNFVQIPYMEGEIAITDSAGFVFWGECGTPLSRLKCDFDVEVCVTDCPRVLLLMSKKELNEVDLRTASNTSQCIFSLQKVELRATPDLLPEAGYEFSRSREVLCHTNVIETSSESILLTTSRRHLLLDRRMLNREILSMPHSEIEGSDYCLTTPPFMDTFGNLIYNIYSLNHIVRPALSHWSIMYHSNERLWSSLGPKYEVASPEYISQFTDYHIESPLRNEIFPAITRAIHYQKLPDCGGQIQKAILFRQMEGGEIWYENVVFDPLKRMNASEKSMSSNWNNVSFEDLMDIDVSFDSTRNSDKNVAPRRYSYKMQSLEHIRSYLQKQQQNQSTNMYTCNINEKFVMPPSSVIIEEDFREYIEDCINTEENIDFDPFATIGKIDLPPESETNCVEYVQLVDNEKKIFSSVIVNMQNKILSVFSRESAPDEFIPDETDDHKF